MKDTKSAVLLVAAWVVISASGCAKAPGDEGSVSGQSNRNGQANSNLTDLAAAPLYAKTVRGDIERAGLAISMAHDFVKQDNWGDALVQLRAAQTHIEESLKKKPPLREQFEELKNSLARAIQMTENRNPEVEKQFTELQARVGALKTYAGG